jgi:large repetitive protein
MPTATHPHQRPRRRILSATAATVALFLASVLAVAWPGPAEATGYGGGTHLEVTKSAVQDGHDLDVTTPLVPGDTFTYVIDVTNTGTTTVNSIKVKDTLPAAVEPAGDISLTDGGTVLATFPGADPVKVTIPSIAPGDSRQVTIPVRVVDGAGGCTTFGNTAAVKYVEGYQGTITITTNVVTLSVGCADLTIHKVADVDGPVVVGDHVTFDISVSLADVSHPVAVKPVVITDDIDESRFAFASATDGGTYAGGVVTWTLPDGLAPGDAPTTVSLTLTILSPGQDASPTYANTACVALTPGDDTPVVHPGDDCDTATIPPPSSGSGSIDLSLAKLVNGLSSTTVDVGDTVTYSLTVANAGPDDATGVVVEDALPAAVTFIEQTGGTGTLSADGATWTVGDVDAGGSATVTFTASVDQTGTHTNVAEVTKADQPDTDSTPGNGCEGAAANEDDCAEATVIAHEVGAASLTLVKTNTPTGTLVGYLDESGNARTVAYTLTVSAGTGADEENVVISDTVPDGTALVTGSLTCDAPGTCTTSASGSDLTWALGTLPAGTSRSVHFTVTVLPPTEAQAAAGSWTITNAGFATSTTHETPSNEVPNEVVVRPLTPSTTEKCDVATPYLSFTSKGWGSGEHVSMVVLRNNAPAGLDLTDITSYGPYVVQTTPLTAATTGTVTVTDLLWPGSGPTTYPGPEVRPLVFFLTGSGTTPSVTVPFPSGPTGCDSTLAIVKSNDPTGVVAFGSTVTYTLTVSVPATGAYLQTGVVVTDTIPGYDASQPTSGTATYVGGSATCVGTPPPAGTCTVTTTSSGSTVTGITWALGTMAPGETRQVTYSVTLEKQDAVVAGSETVDFINVGAVSSESQPSTPSNEVLNTAVVTVVSANEVTNELPHTGNSVPLARLGVFALLLVALGSLLVRQPSLRLVKQPTPRHKA